MSKKMMLLASALAVVAFAALPAMASAGEPQTHCEDGAATCGFTVTGGASALSTTSGLTVKGTGTGGTGTMGTTTGTLNLEFTGVREQVFLTTCKQEGSPEGTVKTTALTYHNTYLTDAKTTPGILVTPGTGEHFATFSCLGLKQEVKGNGILGHLESPGCEGTSNKFALNFETTGHGQQKYKKATATGTEYDLKSNGTTAAMEATGTVSLTSTTATVTCV